MKVGIFWYHNGQVIGRAASVDAPESPGVLVGHIDPRLDHCDCWPALQIRHRPLRRLGYDQVPRGRALLRPRDHRLIIYMDRRLFTPSIKKQVAAFFGTPPKSVTFRTDPHYTTDRAELNRLLDS